MTHPPTSLSGLPRQLEPRWSERLALVTKGQLALVLVCTGVWTYRSSLDGGTLLDDEVNLNYALLSFRDSADALRTIGPRCISYLTLVLNHHLGGLNVRGFHQLNRAIHIANALLLFGLIRRTLILPKLQGRFSGATANWLSFGAALIWLVHPLQTQAVSYIVQRMESMMAFCYLGALYCVVRGARSPYNTTWYIGSIVMFWMGIGAKEVIGTAPLVLLLYDRSFLASSWHEPLRRRRWLYTGMLLPAAILAVSILPYLSSREHHVGMGHPWITPWMYARTQAAVICHYLRLAAWPDQLCLDYCWPVMSVRDVCLPAAILLTLVGGALWATCRRPCIGFPALSFFIILAPTSSFIPINDLAFEHRMYLPLACITALASFGAYGMLARVSELMRWPERRVLPMFTTALLLVSIPLAVRTTIRNADYRGALAMWRSAVRVRPESYRAHYNLAAAYLSRDRVDEALRHFETSFSLLVEHWPDRNKTVQVFEDLRQKFAAAGESERFRALVVSEAAKHRASPLLACLLGRLDLLDRNVAAAARAFERAIQLDKTCKDARRALARTYVDLGRPHDAVRQLCILIDQDPAEIRSVNYLAWILAAHPDDRIRDGQTAVQLAEHVCFTLQAADGVSWGTLAGAYAEVGQFGKAVWAAKRSIESCLKPRDPGDVRAARIQLASYESGRPFRMLSKGHAQNALRPQLHTPVAATE